jgi:putative oxidoreductase
MTTRTMTRFAAPADSNDGLLGLVRKTLDALGRFPMPILELAFRIAVAVVFFRSGMLKLESWETTIALFTDEYRVPLLSPQLAATLATAAELICPVMLVIGVGARLAAAALLFMTMVIQLFVYPGSWSDHLIWASLLGYVFTRGPGPISIDHIVSRLVLGRR